MLLVSKGLPAPSAGAGVWLCGNQLVWQLQPEATASITPVLISVLFLPFSVALLQDCINRNDVPIVRISTNSSEIFFHFDFFWGLIIKVFYQVRWMLLNANLQAVHKRDVFITLQRAEMRQCLSVLCTCLHFDLKPFR